MKSPMLPCDHQAAIRRVLSLGRSGDPTVLPELVALLRTPSNEVQRLAVSAIGKLAEFGADADAAVVALAPLALKARHPQTQQYAIRALKKYAAWAGACLSDLRDLARNPVQRDYVRAAAITTADAIEQAASDAESCVKFRCQRCNAAVSADEYARSRQTFQRYDAKFRIIGEFQIRPDFYLPELDVYIEYWGLDTPQYKMSMYKKKVLYQQEGKRLISVYPADLAGLDLLLSQKFRLFGFAAQ